MRGDGETTRQMEAAEKGAIFVWCGNVTHYPKELARKLGRLDLRIYPLSWFDRMSYRGERTPIVVDHAAREKMNRIQYETYIEVIAIERSRICER